jgi:hypothetical protein
VGFFLLFALPAGMSADGAPLIAAPLAEIAVRTGILLNLLPPGSHELYYLMHYFNW